MPITRDVNLKANIRQKTDSDLASNLGQPVIARQAYISVAGQTLVPASGTLPFAVDQNSKDNFDLFIDGKLLTEGASADYTFIEVDGNNFSSKIQLTAALAAGLNIQVIKRGLKKDAELGIDARIQAIYDSESAGFQGFVDESTKLTAVTTSPSSSQFRSDIRGRASISDLANDLRARMGVDRVMIQQLAELQSEFGPSGERVFAVVNDDRNQIRFIGQWQSIYGSSGAHISTPTSWTSSSDQIEVVFYGTGLNILRRGGLGAISTDLYVDGSFSSTVSLVPSSDASAITARNYSPNLVVPVVNGLSLGLHTVVLRGRSGNADSLMVSGIEILNESSTVKVQPGISYIGGKKLVSSSQQSLAYNSSFESILRDGVSVGSLGSRGARALIYQKSDGTIAKAAIEVDSAQKNLTLADHTNEEVVRRHNVREFGASRSDDFGVFGTIARAFTLEDGTTSLASTSGNTYNANDYLAIPVLSTEYIFFTFVGTGLDVVMTGPATGTYDGVGVIVDGTSVGATGTYTIPANGSVTQKIVSGLPYGTHVVRLNRAVNANTSPRISNFIVYQPKKPTLPAGAVELADYNLAATFVANSTMDITRVSTGVIRKVGMREFTYINGTGGSSDWGPILDLTDPQGFRIQSNRTNAYVEYTFFGTGFDFRYFVDSSSTSTSATLSLNGITLTTANFPTMVSSQYGPAGTSFTASTGILNQRASGGGSQYGSGLCISGLPLARYTLRINNNSGILTVNSIDVITPIHSVRSTLPGQSGNALPVGNCALSDNRKLTPVKSVSTGKAWAQALGVSASASSTSTLFVPIPDMTLTLKTSGGLVEINYTIVGSMNVANQYWYTRPVVNNTEVGIMTASRQESGTGGRVNTVTNTIVLPLPAGTHKIDVYWATDSGTVAANSNSRILTAKEL